MIYVDTNIFVIELRYRRDVNAPTNARFLEHVRLSGQGITGPWNLAEVAGILSHNLNERQLRALVAHFATHFGVKIVPDLARSSLVPHTMAEVLPVLARRHSAGDAVIAAAIEALPSPPTAFVSWDARHFDGKLSVPALTPEQFLSS